MSENKFNIGGVVYIAAKCETRGCDKCAFSYFDIRCVATPPCAKEQRKDGKEVIFIEKHP